MQTLLPIDLLLWFVLPLALVKLLHHSIDKGQVPLLAPKILGSFGRLQEIRGKTLGRIRTSAGRIDIDQETSAQFFHSL